MRFAFSEEQLALKREARRALASAANLAELGWLGLVIPESFGGAGLGWIELCAILEECGRVLSPAPLLPFPAALPLRCGASDWAADALPVPMRVG